MSEAVPASSAHSPAERRRLKVRRAILEAAERVFNKGGAEGLSIRRLAEQIDYSPAAIYKYFGSKEELLDELKEAFFARILEEIERARGADEPFLQRARGCILTYVNTAIERPQHYLAAFSEVVCEAPQREEASNKMLAFAYLTEMVAEGQANGSFHKRAPAISLAKSVWASLHGAAMLIAHLPEFPNFTMSEAELSREAFLDLHANQILAGLARDPSILPSSGDAAA